VFNSRPNGALTYFLVRELRAANGLTEHLTEVVRNANAALQKGHFTQQPQLEGSKAITAKAFLS
jgi:hypothetical protein